MDNRSSLNTENHLDVSFTNFTVCEVAFSSRDPINSQASRKVIDLIKLVQFFSHVPL